MMEKKIRDIETLLARFFEGETTNEEEQQLYLFFRQEDISDELAQYKQVFKYFEIGLADELGCPQEIETGLREEVNTPKGVKRFWLVWGSAAASFLLMLTTSIYLLKVKESFDPYEGSYIIRNGVRITDLTIIKPELEAAMQKSLLMEQEAERLIERLSMIDDSQEKQIMQQLQYHNQQILNDIQDENIRNEVENFLNYNI